MEKKLEDKRIRYVLLGLMTVFFLATRLFRLDIIPFGPHGMHIDEALAAYDAVCVRDWGVDQSLVRCPPYFWGFGGQDALYTYLAVLIFSILPVSIFSFRLVAVICALPAFFALYGLAGRLFKERIYAIAAIAFMTIMPVYLMSERWGLQCNLFMSTAMVAIYFLVAAVEDGRIRDFIMSGVFWGITLYSYATTWVIVPGFLLISLIYLIYVKRLNIKKVLSLAVPTGLLAFPLFIQFLVMAGIIEPFSLPFMDFFTMPYFRDSSIGLSNILTNLKHTTYVLFVADDQIYNSTSKFGLMYYVAIPFVLTGLAVAVVYTVRSIKKREYDGWCLITLFYVIGRLFTLITFEPNTNRMCHMYIPFLLYAVLGVQWLISRIKFKKAAGIVVFCAFSISFLLFGVYYYSWSGHGADSYASAMRAPTQMGETLAEIEKEYGDRYTIHVIANEGYANPLMFALFTETSPYDFKEGRIKGCETGVPEELDLSGKTLYFIDNEIGHITDYLETEGFTADRARCEGFAVVYKE